MHKVNIYLYKNIIFIERQIEWDDKQRGKKQLIGRNTLRLLKHIRKNRYLNALLKGEGYLIKH